MPTINIEHDFDVYCGKCGDGICMNCTLDKNDKRLHVEPCERCLDDAKEAAYNEGYDDGYKKASEEYEKMLEDES